MLTATIVALWVALWVALAVAVALVFGAAAQVGGRDAH